MIGLHSHELILLAPNLRIGSSRIWWYVNYRKQVKIKENGLCCVILNKLTFMLILGQGELEP